MFLIVTNTQRIARLKKRIRAVQGGTSASKTISILIGLIEFAQKDKKPTLTSIVSESMPHLKKGCVRDFKNILKEHNYWKESNWAETDKVYTFETGSQIEFFGADQADKLRGGRRDRLFINEANNVSFPAFEELEVRTREFVYLDWNPTNEFWFDTEVKHKRDDVDFIVVNYLGNEAIDEQTKKSIEQRKNRKGWWNVYGLGELGDVEGKIYSNWQIIDDIPHEARLERYGLDFGYTNDPTSVVAIYYYNGGYILDEVCFTKGMSNKLIADTLRDLPKALVVADSAEPKSIDEIKSYGINIVGAIKRRTVTPQRTALKESDSYLKWSISLVQQQKISVTKQSVNVIKEYRNYLWETDKDGKVLNVPESGFDHSLDAVRYALVSLSKKSYDVILPSAPRQIKNIAL
jgi:phage terminase large subunit